MQKSKVAPAHSGPPGSAPWKFDARVVHRNIQDGGLSPADFRTFLESLPDVAHKAEPMRTAPAGQEDVDSSDDDSDDLDHDDEGAGAANDEAPDGVAEDGGDEE